MQQRAFCLLARPMGSETANSSGSWLNTVQPPCRITFQTPYHNVSGAASEPKMTSVVSSVPRPITTPANAKRSTGVNIAPPNFWIFCIMSGLPPFLYESSGQANPDVFL